MSGDLLARWPESNDAGPVSWVMNPRDLANLIGSRLVPGATVVFDLETTGLDEHAVTGGASNGGVAARVSIAALTVEVPGERLPTTYLVPLSHPSSPWLGEWRAVLQRVMGAAVENRCDLVGHNVKFDARWVFATAGVDLSSFLTWDTMVGSHLLDENASSALKEVVPRLFRVERWDDHDLSKPGASERVDLWELGEYAARDTWWTWRLYRLQRSVLWLDADEWEQPETPEDREDAALGKVARFVSMPTVRSLTRMEQNGIRIDVPWVHEKLQSDEEAAKAALDELAGMYDVPGTPTIAPTSKWFKAFTEEAVANGELRVTATTPSGAPQWSRSVLAKQERSGSVVAETILRGRGATKRSEFLRSWLEKTTPRHRIHANYRSGSVRTGRLASADPNMQQVTKSLRPAFVPDPGHVIVDIDYSQIEMRVAAFLTRSQPMIDAFHNGDDLHRIIAAKVTGKTVEQITPEERQRGKAANFGLLYGMGAAGFRVYAEDVYGVLLSEAEAVAFRNAFFETWTGMEEWHARYMSRARALAKVASPIGRVRRLPDIIDGNPRLVSHAERQAINSPVQGFASDLMQMSAADIQGLLLPGRAGVPGVELLATVHDSIVLQVPEGEWLSATEECVSRMVGITGVVRERFQVDFDIPLAADASVGTRWGLADVGEL